MNDTTPAAHDPALPTADDVRAAAAARARARRLPLPVRGLVAVVGPLDAAAAKLSDAVLDRHYDKVRRTAATDPTWAAIEARREVPGNPEQSVFLSDDLTVEDWETQRRIERALVAERWTVRAARRLKFADSLAHRVSRLGHRRQRTRRGWDNTALWSLDLHLAATLADQLAHFADTTHGWPASDEFPEFEDWQDALYTQSARLAAYARHHAIDDGDLGVAVVRAGQDAMRWVADHFPSLWD